jgi:glucose/arabinose dehydrogenase
VALLVSTGEKNSRMREDNMQLAVARLITALLLITVPVTLVEAQPTNVTIPPGYTMTAVATGLNFPTAMTFFGDTIWVTEEGTATSPPAVKQIDNQGNVTPMLTAAMLPAGTMVSPLTGIVFARGWFWLIHRQTINDNGVSVNVGAISRFKAHDPVGTFQTFIRGFPSFGDHPNSQIVFGADGRGYINGAAPTNSSVVGPDNGWAVSTPLLHDFPGVDVELSGIGYKTLTPFPPLDPAGGTSSAKTTYPYVAFGASLPAGNKVTAPTPANPQHGIIAGGGTVYSFDPDAADPASSMRLEAWGFRNPYGIGFDPSNPNLLFVSNNGADVRLTTIGGQLVIRGSRPIDNDFDDMFVVRIGQGVQFFGHPDYFHDPFSAGHPPLPVTNPMFCPKEASPLPPNVLPSPCPQFAFSDQFRATLQVQPAFAEIELHSSANMFDFSRTQAFGFKGDIFIAETGSIPPGTGATSLTGFKVARIDRETGQVSDFITHPTNTVDVIFQPDGFNKPIDVRFRGPEMFIVDFGVFVPGPITPNSGKVWKVTSSCNPSTAVIAADQNGQPVFLDAPCDR